MRGASVSEQERNAIVSVVQQNCHNIGRSNLADVVVAEIVVLSRLNRITYVFRLRGMTYKVCCKENPSLGIFDPAISANDLGLRIKRGHLVRSSLE